MDAAGFLADLEAKPDSLGRLADALTAENPWASWPADARRVLFLGMGSSHYASAVVAARLRHAGLDAIAELASSDLLPPATPDTVVVVVSAGGTSRETASAIRKYVGVSPIFVVTNNPDGPLSEGATAVVPMQCGPEVGGVACRSFQHTLGLLLALEARTARADLDVPALLRSSAEATADLLARRSEWVPSLSEALLGPDGTHIVAPARRLSSAVQGALMLREGPRLSAAGSETGDWSHADVYLTKTTDYRLLLFAGSRWEDELLGWTTKRGSTVVAVGVDVPEATLTLRYRGDDLDDVRLVSEVLVPELLAQAAWAAAVSA